ncbi:MAG: DUF4065 domain-containing protein, partial [Cyanobacteriota bacterium]|nr:DUF4065 domain-containing protein [Cyanobacteriota bacterium]
SAMKLHKLLYYSQAWSLVWDEQPLFSERIEAWANGPVIPELYKHHKGQFELSQWPDGNPENLADIQRETIDAVLGFYGDKPSFWLSELTHKERPWREARNGLAPGERGNEELSWAAMAEYYGSL